MTISAIHADRVIPRIFGSGGQRNTFSFAVLKLGFDVVVSVVAPVRVVGEADGAAGLLIGFWRPERNTVVSVGR